MAGAAPYELPQRCDVGTTLEFGVDLDSGDGSPFPFDAYVIAYLVRSGSAEVLRLTIGAGLTADPDMNTLDILCPPGRLGCGEYEHALELTETATGIVEHLFDGPLLILGRH